MNKQIIDATQWLELTADVAEWYTEKSCNTSPWFEGEDGSLSYNEEAQAIFNSAYDDVGEILSLHFIKGD